MLARGFSHLLIGGRQGTKVSLQPSPPNPAPITRPRQEVSSTALLAPQHKMQPSPNRYKTQRPMFCTCGKHRARAPTSIDPGCWLSHPPTPNGGQVAGEWGGHPLLCIFKECYKDKLLILHCGEMSCYCFCFESYCFSFWTLYFRYLGFMKAPSLKV